MALAISRKGRISTFPGGGTWPSLQLMDTLNGAVFTGDLRMAENKTKATVADPEAYIETIAEDARRQDCVALMALMSKATNVPPMMWGAAIVGFGVYKYPLAGGKEGEICAVGFSSRKSDISIYGVTRTEGAEALLAHLGKHKLGKGCLYVNRLADVDLNVLEQLVAQAFKNKQA